MALVKHVCKEFATTHADPTVFVVDTDPAICNSLRRLIESVGLNVETYGTPKAFLDTYHPVRPGCLVLDVRLPGMSGLELQNRLCAQGWDIPIIFITGYGDVPMAVRAMKNGAIDFIEKPFRRQRLIDRIWEAIEKDVQSRDTKSQKEEIAARYALLTPRGREVVELLVDGMTNKQIAAKLGVSCQAIDAHRSRAMKKLEVNSVAELVRNTLTHVTT